MKLQMRYKLFANGLLNNQATVHEQSFFMQKVMTFYDKISKTQIFMTNCDLMTEWNGSGNGW